MTRECMVDLETLDVTPAAAIVSIGAVIINPYAEEFAVLGSYYKVLHIAGQDREIDEDTLAFWMKQSDEARAVFQTPKEEKVYLHDMLPEFGEFLGFDSVGTTMSIDKIWSKPSWFDLSIIGHACSQFGEAIPWQHRQGMCFRTLTEENKNIAPPLADGIKHNALDDALYQAKWLWQIRRTQGFKVGLSTQCFTGIDDAKVG